MINIFRMEKICNKRGGWRLAGYNLKKMVNVAAATALRMCDPATAGDDDDDIFLHTSYSLA